MPKTRQQRASLGSSDDEMEEPVVEETTRKSRMALGDVSNRGRKQSSKSKGRAGATTTNDNPAEEQQQHARLRRSTRNSRGAATRTNNISVLEDAVNDDDPAHEAPKRRRSSRSCVLAQRVNNEESTRADDDDDSKPKATTTKKKAKGKATTTQAKSRAAKRRRDEDDDEVQVKQEAKKQKKADKKSSKSSRKRSKSRGASRKIKAQVEEEETPEPPPRKPCSSFLTETNYELVRTPFDGSKFTLGVAPYDTDKQDDVLEVSNYTTDIFQRLYFAEDASRPSLYMSGQREITPAMRAILIDWLVEVHMKFRLVPATLYLCVNIIDRFCSTTQVERRKLQLVGVTALLVACKYEEIYPPEVRDCVYITDRTYTRQEVLDMEQEIVRALEFKMTVPTAHPFLVRFLHITNASTLTQHAANYYMERCLQEYEFLNYRPSLVAAAAVCLALNNPDIRSDEGKTGRFPGIPRSLLRYTGFNANEIRSVARIIVDKVGGLDTSSSSSRRNLVAIKRKFENDKYDRIASEFLAPTMDHLL